MDPDPHGLTKTFPDQDSFFNDMYSTESSFKNCYSRIEIRYPVPGTTELLQIRIKMFGSLKFAKLPAYIKVYPDYYYW
jgi:hypothetical protein